MSVMVNANYFRVAARFVSTEKTRKYLQGVSVCPHPDVGVYITATDGRRQIIIYDVTGTTDRKPQDLPIIKLPDHMLKLCASKRGEHDRKLVVEKDGTASILNGDALLEATVPNVLVDGTYPAWERAAAVSIESIGTEAFDTAYLNDFGKAGADLVGVKKLGVYVFGEAGSSHVVRFIGVDFAYGVIMPRTLRKTALDLSIPKFFQGVRYE